MCVCVCVCACKQTASIAVPSQVCMIDYFWTYHCLLGGVWEVGVWEVGVWEVGIWEVGVRVCVVGCN